MGTPLGPRGIRASDQRANQAQEFLLLWPVTGRDEKGSNLNIGDLASTRQRRADVGKAAGFGKWINLGRGE
jgi:hypothetical protein